MNETILSPTPTFSPYDYSDLDPAIAGRMQELVRDVRAGLRRQVDTILAIGRDLTAAKEQLGHGRFGKWLAVEVGFSERSAENYMSAFAAFGDKSAIVAVLKQPTTIYALASAPPSAREDIVRRIKSGERMADTDVRDAVAEAKQIDRREREQAKHEAERNRRRDCLEQAYALIVDRLGDDLPTALALLKETWQTELARELEEARDRAAAKLTASA
jgi:hypothetical protein